MRLLLVDDDAGLRALLRATFDAFDVEIDEAENTARAAEAIAARPPDAIVLDVMMSGMDGLEYCAQLKADRATSRIPVVLLTGSVERPRNSAADAVMTKPFSPLELLSVVERLVGNQRGVPYRAIQTLDDQEQLLMYARDLRHLLELERGQRALLQDA